MPGVHPGLRPVGAAVTRRLRPNLRPGSHGCGGSSSSVILWGVTTTTRHEVDWLTWSMGEIYPEAFAELLALVPGLERGGNLPAAYNRLLTSPTSRLTLRPPDPSTFR